MSSTELRRRAHAFPPSPSPPGSPRPLRMGDLDSVSKPARECRDGLCAVVAMILATACIVAGLLAIVIGNVIPCQVTDIVHTVEPCSMVGNCVCDRCGDMEDRCDELVRKNRTGECCRDSECWPGRDGIVTPNQERCYVHTATQQSLSFRFGSNSTLFLRNCGCEDTKCVHYTQVPSESSICIQIGFARGPKNLMHDWGPSTGLIGLALGLGLIMVVGSDEHKNSRTA